MQTYRWTYLIAACIVSIVCAGILRQGILDRSLLWILIPAGGILLWWFAFYRFEKGSVLLSLIASGLVCCLFLVQLYDRGRFVIRNGGFDSAVNPGSPVAFLMGLAFELFWFLFFLITAMLGLRILLKQRQVSHEEADGRTEP
jgi:hypothetical protein